MWRAKQDVAQKKTGTEWLEQNIWHQARAGSSNSPGDKFDPLPEERIYPSPSEAAKLPFGSQDLSLLKRPLHTGGTKH
jgi:hypothetical protein